LVSGWLALGLAWAADPVVSNLTVTQRPGTKLVDIGYDLAAAEPVQIGMRLSADDGATWTLPTASLSGDLGVGISAGVGKAVVWDMGADWDDQHTAQLRVEITAADPVYLVIDLSAGSTATSYPVAYLWAIPVGGWTAEHKTTKLVLRRLPKTNPSFTMGSPLGELGREINETQHEVTLTQEFYIGVFELTQKQWERVMGFWPSYFRNASVRDARPVEMVSYDDIRGTSSGAGWPANSAVDAGSFMGKLRQKTGLTTLDLPTESQWEYACRAGTTTALNNGTNLTSITEDVNVALVGRYLYNSGSGPFSADNDLAKGTAAVGSYLANAWGLYDMHGNVYEWSLDWYQASYPGTVSDPRGAASGSYRVLRGGGWGSGAQGCRSACRIIDAPSSRYVSLGCRVARTLP
jgi:formylglycine-generating enzyme required for sulfatase activity